MLPVAGRHRSVDGDDVVDCLAIKFRADDANAFIRGRMILAPRPIWTAKQQRMKNFHMRKQNNALPRCLPHFPDRILPMPRSGSHCSRLEFRQLK